MLASPSKLLLILLARMVASTDVVFAPDLTGACSFMIFGSSAITLGASGLYSGNIGMSPTTIAAVTIPDGMVAVEGQEYSTALPQVYGYVYGPGAATSAAHDAMLSAYASANALPVSGAVDDRSIALGGQTFKAGVYRWSAAAGMAAGSVVNIVGALGDVFIFQLNTLTTGASSSIVLSGGVTPATVFWILGSTLTLGASSSFSGMALAGTAVTVGASVDWTGSVYAQSAITMYATIPYDL
ncbi:hypothetical protein RQP46_010734 [Phenoliferia psychrophenolica]